MSKLKFQKKTVTLDLKAGTLYRLAKAGYSFPESFGQGDTALLAATELLRICSKTDLTTEEVADALDGYESLTKAIADLFDEEDTRLTNEPEKGDSEGNG